MLAPDCNRSSTSVVRHSDRYLFEVRLRLFSGSDRLGETPGPGGKGRTSGAIESCIINVLFQAQRKRTVLDEGAQQIFVVLQGARGVACQIRELINFVNGAIG